MNELWHNEYWCNLRKMNELFGYTEAALRSKIQRAQLVQGQHWRRAPDGRIAMNPLAFSRWLSSAAQK